MMDLRAAAVPFMDEDGLMIERPNRSDGPETGNGIRERCVLEMLCYKRGETTAAHISEFTKVIRSCEVQHKQRESLAFYTVRPIRGLYNRGPRKPGELAAHDDRRCLSAVSSVLSLPFAKEIHDYGKRNWWSFNNLEPGKWSLATCDYRFPGVVPAYRMQAGRKYLPLEDVALGGAILASGISPNPRQKIIWWLTVEALTGRGIFDNAIEYWWQCLNAQYGSMRGVFKAYYTDQPDHPFIHLSPV